MSSKPLVSVIIPAYNAAKTLRATLNSARSQIYEAMEIIVVDDGSSDGTAALLAEMAEADKRVRPLHQPNGGISAARNRGLSAAEGAFIAFLDADDLWDVNHIEVHVRRLAAHPQIALSFSAVRLVDAADRPVGYAPRPTIGYSVSDVLATSPCTTPSAIVVRKDVVSAVGDFDERMLSGAEDQEWLVRLRSAGFVISGCDEAWISYRVHQASISSKLQAMLSGYSQMLEIVSEYEPDLVRRKGSLFEARMSRHLARCAIERGQRLTVARSFVALALKTNFRVLLHEPRLTLSIMAQSHVPGLNSLLRRMRPVTP